MKFRPLASLWDWDELRLVETRAGRHLRGHEPSTEDVMSASRILQSIPRVKLVEVTTGDGWFGIAPAPGQPAVQAAIVGLLRGAQQVGWRVSNLRRRFSPSLAWFVAREYGWHTLGWRKSWFMVAAPAGLVVEGRMQRHPAAVDAMVTALADRPPVMDVGTFNSLSVESISRAMPPEEATDYITAMR